MSEEPAKYYQDETEDDKRVRKIMRDYPLSHSPDNRIKALEEELAEVKAILVHLDEYTIKNIGKRRAIGFPATDQESYSIGFSAACYEIRRIIHDPMLGHAKPEPAQ